MGLRGGRQPTWQPLNLHQAVVDCDAHPRDHSLPSMRGNQLIKAIIAQMVCALFYSKAVSDRAQHLVTTLGKMEKAEEKKKLQYQKEYVQVLIHSCWPWPCQALTVGVCAYLFVCKELSVLLKVTRGVCTNSQNMLLPQCCVLTKGAVSQSGREMLKSFQPTRLHGVFSPLLFIWHLVNHYYSRAPEGNSHTDAHTLKIRPAWTRTLRFTLDDNCLLTS